MLLIHGDAAFAGEGVVQETLNLSQLEGYRIGGTLHVIVNNQLGFTTPPGEGRSSQYATDVAKMLQIPIFHVNGEDPEAVAQVVRLAMDFRSQFRRDVVIDMYCYRRRGHNEGDEPSFTQPLMYKAIERRQSVRDGYLDYLLESRRRLATKRPTRSSRNAASDSSKNCRSHAATNTSSRTTPCRESGAAISADPKARCPRSPRASIEPRWSDCCSPRLKFPKAFDCIPNSSESCSIGTRWRSDARPLDWSAAEALAFASCAAEGYRIRLTGQDSARGTFSQRHAVLHDVETGETYTPLENLGGRQAPVEIYQQPAVRDGRAGLRVWL